jgi:endonuclease-8
VPEGHTLHRLARRHCDRFAGHTVAADSPQGRFPGAAEIDGQVLEGADAYGKHLFHRFEGGGVVHVHLGLIGTFTSHTNPAPHARATVRYRIVGPTHTAHLVGPMACELISPDEADAVVVALGPDPLRRDADPDRAWEALQRRRVPIGLALLDQRVVAGVGNVYRAEMLYVAGIHPEVAARAISREQFDAMWTWLVGAMRRGVRTGRIVTVEPEELGKPRSRMHDHEARYAYKRDLCLRCGTPIRRWNLSGRWAYACESCQRPPDVTEDVH